MKFIARQISTSISFTIRFSWVRARSTWRLSDPTSYTLHTSHYTIHNTNPTLQYTRYTLHTTQCTILIQSYNIHATHFILHTTHFTLHPTHVILRTTCYILRQTHTLAGTCPAHHRHELYLPGCARRQRGGCRLRRGTSPGVPAPSPPHICGLDCLLRGSTWP